MGAWGQVTIVKGAAQWVRILVAKGKMPESKRNRLDTHQHLLATRGHSTGEKGQPCPPVVRDTLECCRRRARRPSGAGTPMPSIACVRAAARARPWGRHDAGPPADLLQQGFCHQAVAGALVEQAGAHEGGRLAMVMVMMVVGRLVVKGVRLE